MLYSARLLHHVENTIFRLNTLLTVGCAPRLPVLNEQDRTRLKYIQPDSHQGRQIILPSATFPDCGEITSWSMKGRCTGRTSQGFQAEVQLQVWNTKESKMTHKRRQYLNRTITLSQCGTAVIQFQGLSGLHFSKGSFLGVFLPPSSVPTFELGIKECCTGVLTSHAMFNVSEPLTKIDILQTFQSQLSTPQISVKGEKSVCSHTHTYSLLYVHICTCTHMYVNHKAAHLYNYACTHQ